MSKEMTLDELVNAANKGNGTARRAAWARIFEARSMISDPKYRTFRLVMGKNGLAQLRRNVEEAAIELTKEV
jgi:hypothetical protein